LNRVVHHLVRGGGGKVWAGYIENHINWGVNKDPETLGPNFDDKIVNSPTHQNTKYNTDFLTLKALSLVKAAGLSKRESFTSIG
jgi:hypothetical protein